MFNLKRKPEMPSAAEALPGRPTPIPTATRHFINQRAMGYCGLGGTGVSCPIGTGVAAAG
jgi:hypothetical protein